ncbi:tail fiber domain-containing protein, partial [Planctomycetota bacterium]
SYATVGGGDSNNASVQHATVGGGDSNTASGWSATVPGGYDNTAAGGLSFAAGRRAKSNHQGAFVWADSTDADFASTANDQFLIRASGGVGINTNDPAGAALAVAGTVRMTGLEMPTGAPDGYVLTCDPTGVGTWQALGGACWLLGGNSVAADESLGTTSDFALNIVVNGARALRLEPTATSPNLIGGHSENNVTAGLGGATISGGGASGDANSVTDDWGTVGGGSQNTAGRYATVGGGLGNTASGNRATVPGGAGNTAQGQYSFAGGGYENEANGDYASVGGGYENEANGDYASVGGGYSNTAGYAATVGGGNDNTASGDTATVGGGESNSANGEAATAGGGRNNTVYDNYGTIAGGRDNVAGSDDADPESAYYATVGGGFNNTASGRYATASGGRDNAASGYGASVSGSWNTASGDAATVPGGDHNLAEGDYSFAAGRRAKTTQNGSFVWADGQDVDFWAWYENSFCVRATGGVVFGSGIDGAGNLTSGVLLQPGQNAWTTWCDRKLKENFTAVDGRDVLARLAAMPITTWNGIAESPDIRHMGPVAQDFHAAFGLGSTDKGICTVDADGVALAAIQGLHAIVREREAQLADLAARLDHKDGEIAELTERLEKLEALMATLAQAKGETNR